MSFIKENAGLEIIKDTDYKVEESWYKDCSESEPEIYCIEGAYINTAIIRKLSCDEKVLSTSEWSDPHGDDRGPDHHNHSSGIKIDIKPTNVDKINKLGEDDKFIIRPGLKFREEGDGLIIALSLNGFFVNHTGSIYLKFFSENPNFSINNVELISNKLGISKEIGLKFLKKLLLFGIVGILND